jgi:hypothetical protein
MIGVVPIAQILQHQDEVGGVFAHACGVDVRRLDRSAARHPLIERQFALVAIQHLHRAPGLWLGRQLHDHRRRRDGAGDVDPVQQRRESAVLGDLLGAHVGDIGAQQLGQPLRGHIVDAGRDLSSARFLHDSSIRYLTLNK